MFSFEYSKWWKAKIIIVELEEGCTKMLAIIIIYDDGVSNI